MAQDPSCLYTVSPCSAQDGSGRTVQLVPFLLVSRGENWLHAIPQVNGYHLLVLQAAALNPEVNRAMKGKALQIECKQGAMFCESAFGSK